MARIRQLNWYQRGILILLLAMALVFAVVYHMTIARVGVLYQNAIFVPAEENGVTVYSGKLRGKQAEFTVSADKTVSFRCDGQTYGPYTVKEDPTARPDLEIQLETGVELWEGDTLLFRGGFWQSDGSFWLRNADGSMDLGMQTYVVENGVKKDSDGNIIDPAKPSASDILRLVFDPELTHKGSWLAWLGAVFLSILNAVSILYADELFRWDLSFQIQNAEAAEPSEWEMMKRYISWTVFVIAALIVYFLGLQESVCCAILKSAHHTKKPEREAFRFFGYSGLLSESVGACGAGASFLASRRAFVLRTIFRTRRKSAKTISTNSTRPGSIEARSMQKYCRPRTKLRQPSENALESFSPKLLCTGTVGV